MNQIERRAFRGAVEVRTEGEGQVYIEGLATPWRKLSEDLGGFREMFLPGAFGDLKRWNIPALWNHNADIVLGRAPGTLSLTDSDDGVGYRIKPPSWASGYVETIERGDVAGTSWGFIPKEGGTRFVVDDQGAVIREVFDAELVEISPVTFPAYPQTDVGVALRSLDRWLKTQQPLERMHRERLQTLVERFL